MAFKFSTEVRRQQAVVGSLKSVLDGSVLRVYSGTVPGSADSALSGNTLLLEIKTSAGGNLTFEPTAPNAVLTKSLSEIWQGDVAANGTASFFRLVKPADTGAATTGEARVQGTVGGPAADLFISNAVLVEGTPQRLENFAIALLESA